MQGPPRRRIRAQQTAAALGIRLGAITSVAESPGGRMWSSAYFPQVSNMAEQAGGGGAAIGGAMQPLTLEVTIGFAI